MRWFSPNPGFELGDQNWDKPAGFTIVNDPANARSGAWVGKLVGDGSVAFAALPAVDVRPGSIIDASIWIKDGTAGNAAVSVSWLDADGVEISFANGSLMAAGGVYLESTAVFTAPNRAKSAQLGARFISGPTGTWFIDDFVASGDVIEDLPASVSLESYRMVPADTIGVFAPLVGNEKFSEFNAGMSDKWSGVWNFTPEARGGDLNALLAFLRRVGRRDRFFAYDPDRTTPVNGVVNGMTVDGAVSGGNTRIPVTGGPVSTTALVAGDYVEIRAQYFQLQRDLEIGPEGTGEMHVWPSVRATIANGEEVITDHPKMVARVTSNLDWMRSAGSLSAPSISWQEVV